MTKYIIKVFNDCGLRIGVSANQNSIDFLDVTFDLDVEIYQSYKKPNSEIKYILKNSNHPPNIINQIAKSIAVRLLDTSSNKEIFMKIKVYYETALHESGYSTNLECTPHDDCQEKQEHRKWKRNIIWFNIPYSKNVQTNIENILFKLFDKHFPKFNKLHEIFNRSTTKIRYSCMKNLNSIISGHNNSVLKSTKEDSRLCNCRNQNNCPLKGKCLTPRIVHKLQ